MNCSSSRVGTEPTVQLERFVRVLIAVVLTFALMETLTFLVFPYPQIGITAAGLACFGIWLVIDRQQLTKSATIVPFVLRTALGVLLIIGACAILQPAVVAELTVAAILPAVIVLPYLDDRPLRWFLGATWLAGVFVVLMGLVMPETAPLPAPVAAGLQLFSMGLAFGLLLFLVWQFSSRLKGAAHELGSLAALSSDLAQTMDPLRIGDLMAEHLAVSTGAAESGICYWDRAGDRVLTYGYYPRRRRSFIDEAYPLAEYPATRRLLDTGGELRVSIDDPAADTAEVAYLRSIGMRSMAMLPLIARGTAIGTVELYSNQPRSFSQSGRLSWPDRWRTRRRWRSTTPGSTRSSATRPSTTA